MTEKFPQDDEYSIMQGSPSGDCCFDLFYAFQYVQNEPLKYELALNTPDSFKTVYKLSQNKILADSITVVVNNFPMVAHLTQNGYKLSPHIVSIDVDSKEGLLTIFWSQRPQNIEELNIVVSYEYERHAL